MSAAGQRLAGRAVVVTGATRGIGRAIALACAREGAAVVVNGRDEAAGRAVLAEIAAIGARAAWHAADLGRVAEAQRLVRAALDAFGRSTSSSTTRACSSGDPLSRWRSGTGTGSST